MTVRSIAVRQGQVECGILTSPALGSSDDFVVLHKTPEIASPILAQSKPDSLVLHESRGARPAWDRPVRLSEGVIRHRGETGCAFGTAQSDIFRARRRDMRGHTGRLGLSSGQRGAHE